MDSSDLVNEDHIIEELQVDFHAFERESVDAVSDGLPFLLLFLLFVVFFLVIRFLRLCLLLLGLLVLSVYWCFIHRDRHLGLLLVFIIIDLKDHSLGLSFFDTPHLLHEGERLPTRCGSIYCFGFLLLR